MTAYDRPDEQRYYDRAEWGILHPYQREVLADLRAILPDDARSILDVGCGDGMITDRLPGDRLVIGADLSPVALSGLKRPGLVCSAFELPFPDRAFDLVMANDVIEHFSPEHRERVLGEIERVAARYAIVTVPFAERLANGFSYAGRAPVHRNRHRDSFDVDLARGFFRGFDLKACVFSGSTWEDELGPVDKLKTLQASLADTVPDGRERAELSAAIGRALRARRKRQAAYLCRHPEKADLFRRRTEMIALFARTGTDWPVLQALGDDARDFATARENAEEGDLLRVEGARFDAHRRRDLPFSSLWPFVVFNGQSVVEDDGARLTAEAGEVVNLKIGLFAPLEDEIALEVEIRLEESATVHLRSYEGGTVAYRLVESATLDAGLATFRVAKVRPSLSEFGYLFEIAVEATRCTFVSARIVQGRPARRPVVAEGSSFLARTVDGVVLLTSLAGAPRRALPFWFASAELIAASRDAHYANLDAVRLDLDEFRLGLVDDDADGGARLRSGGSQERDVADLASVLQATQRRLLRARSAHLSLARRLALLQSTVTTDQPLQRFRNAVYDLRARLRIRTRLRQLLHPRPPTVRFLAALAPAATPTPRVARSVGSDLPLAVTMLVADDRIDRRVLLQARSLARQGVRVTVVAAPYPDAVDLDAAEFPDVSITRIDTARAARNPPSVAGTRLGDHRFEWTEVYFYHEHFLQAAVRNPAEIVVAHDLPILAAAIGAADLTGADVFYDAHELYPEQLHFGPARMQLYRDAEAALIRHADVVTTINPSIAAELARRYDVPVPSVILNAPEAPGPAVPAPPTRLLRDAFGLSERQRIVLFQGSLSIGRNLEPLAASLAHVENPDVVLIFMGPGAEKRAELEAIARGRGLLGTRVFFHDFVPQSELLRYTASADIGIIPYPAIDLNTTYCTPNKLFEFMAAGLPILANDLPELRRFVADAGVGLVHAMTDAETIAAGIDRICAADLTSFRAALRDVAPRMTWDAQEPVLLGIYRDFLGRRDQKAA